MSARGDIGDTSRIELRERIDDAMEARACERGSSLKRARASVDERSVLGDLAGTQAHH
ncbi:Hypothetical protein A7982_00550 [Minicystis rosea]|nr:Hypothetical protein A7982_00550 [Minicystis rosea]